MNSPANLGRGSGAGESIQQELFERPEFSPVWPRHASKSERVLEMLLAGNEITQRDFIDSGDGWRLAAYIHELKEELGWWPIDKREIHAPIANCAHRKIARYFLPKWVIQELGGDYAT